MLERFWRWTGGVAMAALALLLPGCDPIALDKLKVGQSTEADVRDAMGRPEMVWDDGQGARTLEYNRQPQGHVNYMISIGGDGRLQAVRQVLNEAEFAKVQPGMHYDQVRRMLGKPAKDVWYPLKREHEVDWRYLSDPTTSGMFTVVLDANRVVLRAHIGPDMDEQYRSGGGYQ
ncbi:outer membrane protein assembly factor BamE [Corticibacter populi]|uniref:Outer membrane protein assembly factor BamE n=1 Tax=Corticibacter populi TaxID=1550736 RepID=A0A3M6QK66_9BURK|nr:outer membrane protein assembly factor BamE [Corticibacter populi]RMX03490.1 outer membrane protein assembly factor BamE [Corticibacter populi]RZS29933.1 Beta-barrel assembly machine subunit BamE [Corticibacter populi]